MYVEKWYIITPIPTETVLRSADEMTAGFFSQRPRAAQDRTWEPWGSSTLLSVLCCVFFYTTGKQEDIKHIYQRRWKCTDVATWILGSTSMTGKGTYEEILQRLCCCFCSRWIWSTRKLLWLICRSGLKNRRFSSGTKTQDICVYTPPPPTPPPCV